MEYTNKQIEIACKRLKMARAICDKSEKEYENAKKELIALTGETEFTGHGVTVTPIIGKPYVDWKLAAPALGITDAMTQPFTKFKANSLRITVERVVAID